MGAVPHPARAQSAGQPTAAAVAAPATGACDPAQGNARLYLDCLAAAAKAGQERLDAAYAGALAAIRADEAVAPVQRQRWANAMDEAQGRFVRWRNFECQNIAPYEGGAARRTVGGRLMGPDGLGQRLLCLIAANDARRADLSRRYPPPPGWTYTPPAAAPAPATSPPPPDIPPAAAPETPPAPTPQPEIPAPTGPVRIIDMP
nr:lysozyme inhibitor LprI family protein [Ancylobacter lacus]